MAHKITFLSAFLIFTLASSLTTFALDTTSTKFFPLKIGNSWMYYYYVRPAPPYPEYGYRYKTTIFRDTIISNHKFYLLSNGGLFGISMNTPIWLRIDSVTGALITPSSCTVKSYDLLDSLSSSLNDTSYKCLKQVIDARKCSQIATQTIFGFQTITKSYDALIMPVVINRKYSRNFGLTHVDYGEEWYYSHNLLGCILNGVVYGDTSLTGVINITNELPNNYALSQNYPNPFNPSTNIHFDLSKKGIVELTVYDILGNQISKLVNEELNAGSYSVDWNASAYSSGIYFYKIQTGDFMDTKRMVLMK